MSSLVRLLTSPHHFRPTSADLALASRILLLTHAPLPNPALKDLVTASYPSLVEHATRIHALAFPATPSASNPPPKILPPPQINFLSVLKSSITHLVRRATSSAEESEEAKRFRRYRWGWYALAVAGAVGYIMTQGFVPIRVVVIRRVDPHGERQDEDEDEAGEEDEYEGEELLDDGEMEEINV